MRTLTAFLLVAITAACTSTGSQRADDAARREIQEASEQWVAAYNSRDPARLSAAYAPDAVFWGTTMKSIAATPAGIAEYFKNAAKSPDARVAIGEHHVRVYDNVAFNAGHYTFSNVRDGKPTSTPARFTFVFERRDGRWVMVHQHSSRMP